MQLRLAASTAALALAACSGHPPAGSTPTGIAAGPAAPGFAATRWVPAHPTYAVAVRTVRDAQHAGAQLVDTLGVPAGLDQAIASALLKGLTGLDLLSPDAVTGAGVDVDGGVAVFSEDLNPTVVLHLRSPDQMKGFLAARQPQVGPTQSVIVAGVEILTVGGRGDHTSWAIDHDWMWVHYAIGREDGTAWFEHSRAGGGGALPDWQRAQHRGKPSLIAFADTHALVAAILARAPGSAAECAQRFSGLGHVDAAFDVDERHVDAQVAIELGASARGVEASLLPAPAGWAGVATGAPFAGAWNADLPSAIAWAEPCLDASDVRHLRGLITSIRAARAVLLSFEPDDTSFTGVAALDLSSAKPINDQLDDIPLRSHLESNRTFGPYPGKHLSIPMMFAVDYVLTNSLAVIARGDGLLLRAVSGPPASGHPPILTLDVAPQAMTAAQWQGLAALVHGKPKDVERLMFWRALHLGAALDGDRLVIDARAERR